MRMRRARHALGSAVVVLAGIATVLATRQPGNAGAIRTVVLGQNPTLVAIDGRTARAFVLDQGSLVGDNGGGIAAGDIHVLDARTGALLRTVPAGTNPSDVVVDEWTARVFVVYSYMHNGGQGTVTVLDARTGQVLRTTTVGDGPFTLALDADAGRVFVCNQPNGVVRPHARYALVSVLDAASGRLIGGLNPAPSDGTGLMADSQEFDMRHHWALLPVIKRQASVSIDVFDTRDGTPVRRIHLGHDQDVVDGGIVVVSAATRRTFIFTAKRVLVLDTASGRIQRLIRHPIYGQPLVDERTGRVFVAEQDWSSAPNSPNWGRTETGALAILDARTGALLGKLSVEWPDGLAVDPRTGRLLILHAGPKRADGSYVGAGHVDVRDGRTGHLIRTIGVGVAPAALAVDQQTGQALVVNAGGVVRVADSWGWLPRAVRQRLPLLPPPPGPTHAVASSVSLIALDS